MKKLLKIALILFSIGLLSGVGVYLYVFHKPHRNIDKEKPAYTLLAENLYQEFSEDESISYQKYGNQVLQVKGEVVEISVSDNSASLVFLDQLEGINCSFDSLTVVRENGSLMSIREGDEVTLKGKCDGFDMIMGVVLTRCVLVN